MCLSALKPGTSCLNTAATRLPMYPTIGVSVEFASRHIQIVLLVLGATLTAAACLFTNHVAVKADPNFKPTGQVSIIQTR